ncbi:hypothetical protein PanWU01x14_042420 [Parasponia andersonii]|uniref:Uncharacterized protein n=1 Tax=Parasponia andersonii TaxID=3476 RepID=A0A2P5DQR1_PARAD|nr:hypothetical protein PanWU01x14_042420 [Parasponia andersonii]
MGQPAAQSLGLRASPAPSGCEWPGYGLASKAGPGWAIGAGLPGVGVGPDHPARPRTLALRAAGPGLQKCFTGRPKFLLRPERAGPSHPYLQL